MYLRAVQTFARPLDEIFPFFSDARNLAEITPSWMQFAILNEGPIEMRPGTRIDYRLRVHGLPLRWQSEITIWEPGARFVDVQTRGPYRRWRHEHRFVDRDGTTEMHDRVDYEVPLGRLVERWLVRPQLRRIFEYRQAVLAERFGQIGTPAITFHQSPPPMETPLVSPGGVL